MTIAKFEYCEETLHADIAIVGAGIAGLYCAWRLVQQDPKLKIIIVERLNRTGGRLDSDIVEIKPGELVREEQGGMRFNDSMKELMGLIGELGLCNDKDIVPFPMSSHHDTNRFFVRGRSFTAAEAEASDHAIWSELYELNDKEKGLSPTQIVINAYNNVLYANEASPQKPGTPDYWTWFREEVIWGNEPMNQWQLWGLLRDMGHSEACIQMLSETIGFAGPFKSMANAGDAFQLLADFPENPTYYTFAKGFSMLPDTLCKELEDNYADQVQIYLSTNVDSIFSADQGFELNLTQVPENKNAKPFIPSGKRKFLYSNKLILAVAAKGLKQLFITSPVLHGRESSQQLWDCIHSAIGMKLMKINLYFDKPWWENGQTGRPSVQFGPNFSNLPINAVYPFYSLPNHQRLLGYTTDQLSTEQVSDPTIRDAAAALTIYCDFDNTNFWQGLQNIGPMFTSELQMQQKKKQTQTIYAASLAVVEEARKQLAALFDTTWVPEPVLTSYRLWGGEDDFEYAYHQWGLNVVDSAVRKYLSAPLRDLYICNEAFSDMQGWVNGSLRSADLALNHFGLEPLSSLSPCTLDGSTLDKASTEIDAIALGSETLSNLPHKHVPGLWGG
ncbi:MAG: flavin monoamine oxidase family protein [Phormidesmis sp.]